MDFGGGDIAAGIRLCIDIYHYGFSADNAADVRYIQFRNDVLGFERLLRTLHDAIRRAHDRHQTRLSLEKHRQSLDPLTDKFEDERIAIIGNFSSTLKDCKSFLESKKRFTTQRSNPLENLGWHLLQDEQRVNDLRQRISFHMYKIRFAIDRLSLDVLSDIDADVGDTLALQEENLDVSNATLFEVKKFRSELFGYLAGQRDLPSLSAEDRHSVPPKVESKFEEALKATPSQSAGQDIPLSLWFDALVYSLEQSNEGSDPTPENYLAFLKTRWLMSRVRESAAYKDARPGFYFKRACNQVDKALRARLRNPGDLIPFPDTNLLELPATCFAMWKPAVSPVATEIDLKLTEPQGDEQVVKVHLANEFPGSTDTLTVLKRSDLQFRTVREIALPTSSQQVLVPSQIDVRHDHLVPRYLLPTLAEPCLEMSIHSRGSENSYRFQTLADLYELQAALTGFEVSHDQAQITCQFSKLSKYLDCDTARIQLWQEPLGLQDSDHSAGPSAQRSHGLSSGSQAQLSISPPSTVAQTADGFEAQAIKKCAVMLFSKHKGDTKQHLFNIVSILLPKDCFIDNTACSCRRDYDKCSLLVLVREKDRPLEASFRHCDLDTFDLLEFRANSKFRNTRVAETRHLIFKFRTLAEKNEFRREISHRFAVRDAQIRSQQNFLEKFQQRQENPQGHSKGSPSIDRRRSSSAVVSPIGNLRLPQLPAIESGPAFSGFLSTSPSSAMSRSPPGENKTPGDPPGSDIRHLGRLPPKPDADSGIGIDFEKRMYLSGMDPSAAITTRKSSLQRHDNGHFLDLDKLEQEGISPRDTFGSNSTSNTQSTGKKSTSLWKKMLSRADLRPIALEDSSRASQLIGAVPASLDAVANIDGSSQTSSREGSSIDSAGQLNSIPTSVSDNDAAPDRVRPDEEAVRVTRKYNPHTDEDQVLFSKALARELVSLTQADPGTGDEISPAENVTREISAILRVFAIAMESVAQPGLQKRAVSTVYFQRRMIAQHFVSSVWPSGCNQFEGSASQHTEVATKEASSRNGELGQSGPLWDTQRQTSHVGIFRLSTDTDEPKIFDFSDCEGGVHHSEMNAALSFLRGGCEFQWLADRIRVWRQNDLGSGYLDLQAQLWRAINRGKMVQLSMAWQAREFLDRQYGQYIPLSSVLCMSGTASCAQATTICQYLATTWPRLGPDILTMVDAHNLATTRSSGPIDSWELPGVHVSLSSGMSGDVFELQGQTLDLLECAEVLAFLSAACQPSDKEDCVQYCDVSGSPAARFGRVSIAHRKSAAEPAEENAPLCWTAMFNNPVIVHEFPVRRRSSVHEVGLEMPLDIAAFLSSARFPTTFEGRFLFKGPCSALVPVTEQNASITWHFVCRPDLSPLSYQDALAAAPSDQPISYASCMRAQRHFFGWTPVYALLAGTENCNYDTIGYGARPVESAGLALSQVTVAGGYKFFTLQSMFVPGNRDQRPFLSISGTYQFQLKCFSRFSVVLFDIETQRGWLLDGTTFLLLLSRAALSHPFSILASDREPHAQAERFLHLDTQRTDSSRRTAEEVLLSDQNRGIELLSDGDASSSDRRGERMTFEDLVRHFINVLEQLAEHHIKLRNAPQWQVRNPFRTQKWLEGFEFLDILQMKADIRPRATKIRASASRWLKVVSDAGTMNILGTGFGDLFEHAAECCPSVRRVPHGSDVLAAPVSIINRIAQERASSSSSSIELAQNVFWDDPIRSFGHPLCRCHLVDGHRGCVPAFTELAGKKQSSGQRSPTSLPPDIVARGAVIFGRPRPQPAEDSLQVPDSTDASLSGADSGIEMLSLSTSNSSRADSVT